MRTYMKRSFIFDQFDCGLGLITDCFANGLLDACCIITMGLTAVASFFSWAIGIDATEIKTVNASIVLFIIETS